MANFAENIKNLILSKLEEIATPKKKAREMAFFKYKVKNIIGTGVKPMRSVVHKICPEIRKGSEEDIISAAEALINTRIYEAQMAAIEILYQCKDMIDLHQAFCLAEMWIDTELLDNWATVDDIAKYVMGYAVMEEPELGKTTYRWAKSKNHWLRRASLVTYIIPARESKSFDIIFKTARKLMRDDNEYVAKAVGWVLREAGDSDKRRLENFIFKYGKDMRRISLRSAIEKFPPEERSFLIEQTKAGSYMERRYREIEEEDSDN